MGTEPTTPAGRQHPTPPERHGADVPIPDGRPPHRDAFGEWAGPSLLPMTRLALRLAPRADADDVVQNALERAWRNWAQFDPKRGTATSWLLAITADQARAARRVRVRRLRVIDETTQLPDAPSVDGGTDLDLQRAIDQLAERARLAVNLHYFLGLSVAETAAVMGCTPGTVKSTLHDARARLRTLLGDDDEH